MEKKRINCPEQFRNQIIEYFSLFGYQVLQEKKLPFSRLQITFARHESNQKADMVMMKHSLHPFLTFYPLVVGCFLILLIATLFLVFSLTGNGDRFNNFLYFMVPTFALLPLIALYTFLRYTFDSKNIAILTDLNEIKKDLEE